jgi:predicted PurR-regulated permease PerM
LVFILTNINDCMIVFFRGQVLVALCVVVLLSAVYLIMGLNYALLLGLIAGTLEIVPYLGTIVGLVLALAVAGAQFKDWTHPMIVFGIVVLMKLLEDLVLAPRIVGKRVGLHPLAVIVAVMVGTTLLGGFIGALLAIPLTAALRTLMFRYIWIKDRSGKDAEASI